MTAREPARRRTASTRRSLLAAARDADTTSPSTRLPGNHGSGAVEFPEGEST